MLFAFVRAAFASPRTACTDLSRRLRDGVSLPSVPPIPLVDWSLMLGRTKRGMSGVCACIMADKITV